MSVILIIVIIAALGELMARLMKPPTHEQWMNREDRWDL